jgi:hypothetical protein
VGTNKQFDNILNECLEKLITGQETVEQCLQRYPQYAAELEPLLRTATMVNKAVDVKPSAEFRAKARYEMRLKMAQSKAPVRTPARAARYVPRWAIAVGTAMLVFVLGGGSVLASTGVMPGNVLYGVKLAKETVQVKLAGSTEKKTELYVTMAATRVAEMTWMAGNNKTRNIEAAALRLDTYYTQIGKLAMTGNNAAAYSSNSLTWPGATYNSQSGSMTQAATTQTAGAGKSAPPSPAASTTTALATVTPTVVTPPPATTAPLSAILPSTVAPTTAVTTTTTGIIAITIPPATSTVITIPQPVTTFAVTQTPDSLRGNNHDANNSNQVATNNGLTLSASNYSSLMNILLYNSVTQPEEIQKLLDSDKVPESVKPALRRALAASLINYQNAINNFSSSGNNSTGPGNP